MTSRCCPCSFSPEQRSLLGGLKVPATLARDGLCVKDQECRGSNCRDADKNFLSFRLSVLLADKYRSPNTENTKQNQTYLKPLGRIVSGTQTEMRLSSGKFQEACGCISTMESSVRGGGGSVGLRWGMCGQENNEL